MTNVSSNQICPGCGKPAEQIQNLDGQDIWRCNSCGNRFETSVTRTNEATADMTQPIRDTGRGPGDAPETLPK